MLLATWNVNSIRARMDRVLAFLAARAPDVVCLQETRCTPAMFPHLEIQAAGYVAAEHSAGQWNGVAILARDEPRDVVRGLPGESVPGEARWIETTVAGVRVASVYVPNGREPDTPHFADKLAFLEAMARRVDALDPPLVVAGDVNVAPADLDVYSPAAFAGRTHTHPEERRRVRALLDAGLVDAFRHVEPDAPGFTWWNYRPGQFDRDRGLRIDLVLASPDLVDRCAGCRVDREFRGPPRPSDHAPVLVELR